MFAVDQKGSENIWGWIYDQLGSIKEFDTLVHSHPYEDRQDSGLKSIGHNLAFSEGDINSYLNHWMARGIKKTVVESNGMVNELDLSELNEQIRTRIQELYNNYMKTDFNTAWKEAKDFDRGVFDYDVRDKFVHQAMQGFIKQALV
jgi:hypothetical protein